MHNINIKNKLAKLPLCPGVYLMKDKDGKIIYVGKSKLLKNRVSQYFQNSATHSPKTRAMVKNIYDFEYIITDTENEALALECNLIKKYRPKYNILLKDDKQYPYVKITVNEDFPRMYITRRLTKDGSMYLGPFMTTYNLRDAVEEIKRIFGLRNCSKSITTSDKEDRPCLYYQMGQCFAPCCKKISKDEYHKLLIDAIDVLNGNYKKTEDKLKKKMYEFSDQMDYEKAAQIRDKISYIKAFAEKQKIASTDGNNMDFIGVYTEHDQQCIQVFYYRNGNAVGSEYFTLKNDNESPNELLEGFVKQFYFTQTYIPQNIFISHNIDDKEGIESWLSNISGHKIHFHIPQKGAKANIMKMVLSNARESLNKDKLIKSRAESYQNRILSQLKDELCLRLIPHRIELYDISHFSGSSSTGVQVVFQNAVPAKKLYRKYNIKHTKGIDDYESMREVIYRRINEAYKEEDMIKSGDLSPEKSKFLPLPDIILLDGGKGHISAVQILLDTMGEDIKLFGLVKDGSHKTRCLTDGENEYVTDKHSELFNFLSGMQEEVHRYAITATRKKHEKSNTASQLEKISGVGPATRKKLLMHFGGIKPLKYAALEDLCKVVNKSVATNIIEHFKAKEE